MKTRSRKGVSTIEFALSMLVLVPLVLGTGAIGINLIRTLQTIQLARDAGHMLGKGVDFSDTDNQDILVTLGQNLGLNRATPTNSKSVVILSAFTYVDNNTCIAGTGGGGCANINKWVFVQRIVIGKSSIRSSNYGTPTGVPIDSGGRIAVADYTTKAGAVATFGSTGFNPYNVVNGNVSGMPSGQRIYLAEAAAIGFGMPPFSNGSPTYSFAFF